MCYCYDIQHSASSPREERNGNGTIHYRWADLLSDSPDWDRLFEVHRKHPPQLIMAWPMCTDLAVSGARHWAAKARLNPDFQKSAAANAIKVESWASALGVAYMVENPIGVLGNLWRHWDWRFHPYEFGGYLPPDSPHPRWPTVIPPQDRYTKNTCIWSGNGYIFPERRPVEPNPPIEILGKNGKLYRGSSQWANLGGKSLRTKNIRSATPRGFAIANFLANRTT